MDPISEKDLINFLPADLAWHYKVVPRSLENGVLTLLISSDSVSDNIIGELELVTGYNIEIIQEDAKTIEKRLSRLYRKDVSSSKEHINISVGGGDLLLKIIFEARDLQSSDIHFEPFAAKCRIRIRIDGKLVERYQVAKDEYASFVNKVKIKAKLDIAEKRLPQDGRILIVQDEKKMDIRVSILPTLHGEKIVLRLLSNDNAGNNLQSLGLDKKQLSDFTKILNKPHGIILISGPTGSGKTTTLYATLKQLNNESRNILTIEDPIEYTLEGINQVQLKENIGLTFSQALRTFLRQDPDIIMLGEIRDGETAQMAIRAALTGHLVLSTIHTNSAWGIVSRLIDMGVPSFLLANTLNMTIAQRLVRKLCTHCKKAGIEKMAEYIDNPELRNLDSHFVARGCAHCYYTGYSGRIALYEIIPVDNELSRVIKDNVPDIDDLLAARGISTLRQRAFELLKEGMTSIDEVYPIFLNQ